MLIRTRMRKRAINKEYEDVGSKEEERFGK
jgi:hypothetical protein